MRKFLVLFAFLLLGLGAAAQAGWEEGVAAFKAKNYQQALAEFQAVASEQPDWPGGHLMVGQALLKLNRPAEAERALRKSYDLNPNDASTQLLLGQTYVALKRYRDAAELLKTIKVDGLPKAQQSVVYHLRGTAYQKSGRVDSALADLQKAAGLNPDDAGLQYQYGTLLLGEGDTKGSLAPLKKAASLEPADAGKQTVYIQALLRSGRESKGQAKINAYRTAAATAKALVDRDGSYDNLLLYGEAQLGAKDYKGAVTSFKSAAAKSPGQWLPNLYLGQAHTALAQYSQAIAPLDKALGQVDSDRDRKRIQRQLGFVYEKQKNFDQAISFYNQAGDKAGADRVAANKEIAEHNVAAEQEAAEYERLMEEEEELKKALEELEGGGGGR